MNLSDDDIRSLVRLRMINHLGMTRSEAESRVYENLGLANEYDDNSGHDNNSGRVSRMTNSTILFILTAIVSIAAFGLLINDSWTLLGTNLQVAVVFGLIASVVLFISCVLQRLWSSKVGFLIFSWVMLGIVLVVTSLLMALVYNRISSTNSSILIAVLALIAASFFYMLSQIA